MDSILTKMAWRLLGILIVALISTSAAATNKQPTLKTYSEQHALSDITPTILNQRLTLAGSYLAHAVNPDGKFRYSYLPDQNRLQNRYNILRHAGAIYAMAQLYQLNKDPQLLQQAKTAISYLVKSAKLCGTDPDHMMCIVEGGHIKLGGNALAIIALAKYAEVSHDQQYNSLMRSLANWIVSVQAPSGQFLTHKMLYLFWSLF